MSQPTNGKPEELTVLAQVLVRLVTGKDGEDIVIQGSSDIATVLRMLDEAKNRLLVQAAVTAFKAERARIQPASLSDLHRLAKGS